MLELKAQLVISMWTHTWKFLILAYLYTVRGHYLSERYSDLNAFSAPNQDREPRFWSFYCPPLFKGAPIRARADRPRCEWLNGVSEWRRMVRERRPISARLSVRPTCVRQSTGPRSMFTASRGWIFKSVLTWTGQKHGDCVGQGGVSPEVWLIRVTNIVTLEKCEQVLIMFYWIK